MLEEVYELEDWREWGKKRVERSISMMGNRWEML